MSIHKAPGKAGLILVNMSLIVIALILIVVLSILEAVSSSNQSTPVTQKTLAPGAGAITPLPTSALRGNQPPEKLTGEAVRIAEQTVVAKTPTIPPKEAVLTKMALHPPFPTSTPFTGIDNDRINSKEFLSWPDNFYRFNSWTDRVNGKWMEVWAGGRSKDSEPVQGIIYVAEGKMYENVDKREEYLTPTKAGGVKITAVVNLKFTLESETGVTFFFDLPSRTFVFS
jgi:hypothetical protein